MFSINYPYYKVCRNRLKQKHVCSTEWQQQLMTKCQTLGNCKKTSIQNEPRKITLSVCYHLSHYTDYRTQGAVQSTGTNTVEYAGPAYSTVYTKITGDSNICFVFKSITKPLEFVFHFFSSYPSPPFQHTCTGK
jgi:hypothetical protein